MGSVTQSNYAGDSQPTNKLLDAIRELGISWELETRIQDGHLSHLFKRCGVVAQLVQEHTQSPDIALLIDGLLSVYVDHFRASVLQRSMPLYIVLDQPSLCSSLGSWAWRSGRSEIT